MKREIKFRGLRTETGKWVYGDLLRDGEIFYIRHHYSDIENDFDEYSVIPETVGQFTGLKDRSFLDLYEGDIIIEDCPRQNVFRIYSVAGGFALSNLAFKSSFTYPDPLVIQPLADAQTISYVSSSCTITGNIHQQTTTL